MTKSSIVGIVSLIGQCVACRRQKCVDAYRAEVSCIHRLRHEIATLRRLVSSQQQTISSLSASCEQLRREKCLIGLCYLHISHYMLVH